MDNVLISFLTIMSCGIAAQWLSWRLGIPGIALFLMTGFLAGPVMGWVSPGFLRNDLLYATVSTFVAIILFEGSLQLKWRELSESGSAIANLVIMGGMVTMVLVAVAGMVILGLDAYLSILLGAILIVTGPTVVLPLVKQIRPSGNLAAILKWEGIAIDPLGALLAVLVYEVILSEGPRQVLGLFTVGIIKTVLVGFMAGVLAAGIIIVVFRNYLIPEHLRDPFVLTVMVAAFIWPALLENEPAGFLAVTVMGVTLANQILVPIRRVVIFKESLKTLLLPALFIILAARVSLSQLSSLDARVVIFCIFLILVVRPLAVFLSTRSSNLSGKEKLFLSCMAPRGIVAAAVASLFSDRLVQAGLRGAASLVTVVFFVVSCTVLFYAIVTPWLAWVLGLSRPRSSGILVFGINDFSIALAKVLKDQGAEVILVDRNSEQVGLAKLAGLDVIKDDIFSEEIAHIVEERGLGRLLALTQNPEANSLAIEHFRHIMAPGELYQLTPPRSSKLRAGHNLVGRLLFDEQMDYHSLQDLIRRREIMLHEADTPNDALEGRTMLFASDSRGNVLFNTTDQQQGFIGGKRYFGFQQG